MPVHLVQGDGDRVTGTIQRLRHVLEHVFDWEVELRRGILQLIPDEIVRFEVFGRKADHRVDDADPTGWTHRSDSLEALSCWRL